MGKIQLLDIVYDHPFSVFHAGSSLSGRAVFDVSEGLKLDAIQIEVKGKAHTEWTRHHGKSSTHYSGHESYFNDMIDVQYLRDFPDGRITPEDLNSMPSITEPIVAQDTELLDCFCCMRGQISLNLCIPKRGFVPGEQMPITCHIENRSNRSIDNVTARLKQYVHYKGFSHWGFEDSKETSFEVAKLKKDNRIRAGDIIQWTNEYMIIPSLPPRLVGCKIIDVKYVLKFNVGHYIYVNMPLIIGTVPLRPVESMDFVLDPPPPYVDPPSYQECVLGRYAVLEQEEDDGEAVTNAQFAPCYVFYGNL